MRQLLIAPLALLILTGLGACQTDLVHQRPVAELNMKAQQLMQAGDHAGAIARLESARDLAPEETKTLYNLAIAYQAAGQYDQSIATFESLLDKPGIEQAEVLKSLGILYEAKGDEQTGKVKDIELKESATAEEKAQIPELAAGAKQNYQLAIDFYQRALPGLKKDTEAVQAQIEALNKKLTDPDNPGVG